MYRCILHKLRQPNIKAMKNQFRKIMLLAALAIFSLSACSDDENNTTPQSKPTYDMTGFAKGADVSWLTEMEKAGSKFYNASGAEQDCMMLLRDLGVNSIRLRVWVDPQDGWSGKQDVLAKAWRAKNLGQRIMIDFHYSDSWADPGKQNIPAAWTDYKDDLLKMKAAVAEHTTDVLSFLKENGIGVEWIQIGNETTTGMLWPLGLASDNNFANYAALNNAGYDAAKAVYPEAQCIIHIDQGNVLGRFTWMFDGLKAAGAKWDVIGMSLYPYWTMLEHKEYTADRTITECIANINSVARKYNCDVMVVETGMECADDKGNLASASVLAEGKRQLARILKECKENTGGRCKGVFYWEPECRSNQYRLGAFTEDGRPTVIMDAFK